MCAVFGIPTDNAVFGATFKEPAAQQFLRAGEVVLNEVVIAPPGDDSLTGCEYVEFRGIPGVPTGNFIYVDLEGDREQNPGVVNYVRNLQGVVPGSNGIIAIVSNGSCRNFNSQAKVIFDLSFQSYYSTRNNGTNSFLLLRNSSNFQHGQDLDVNNDGLIDAHPSGAFDGIAVYDGFSLTDIVYSSAVLPRRPETPLGEAVNAATRFIGNDTRNSTGAFYYGDLCTDPRRNTYRRTILGSSLNFPWNGRLTPGATNVQ